MNQPGHVLPHATAERVWSRMGTIGGERKKVIQPNNRYIFGNVVPSHNNRQTAQGAHMRFTLTKLFLIVTMAALAWAGMTLHTRLWAESIVSFSIVLYIAVAILAFRSGGQARAFRIAFAAVGGGYLLLVLCNVFSPIRDLLIINRALVSAGQSLQVSAINQALPSWSSTANFTTTLPNGTQATSPAVASSGVTGPATLTGSTAFTLGTVSFDWDDTLGVGVQLPDSRIPAGAFLIVGHCLWSWLLALAAGCFAAFACRPRALSSPK
jgi:hypothetical protein